MKVLRNNAQFLCIFMAVLMLIVSIPCQSVIAALIDTETVSDSVRGREARDQLKQLLAREDVQAALTARGIDRSGRQDGLPHHQTEHQYVL